MRILVTGASGFIGAAVVRHAIAKSHEVVGTVRPGADLWRLPALWAPNVMVNYTFEEGITPTLVEHLRRVDAVIHCAWENGRAARDDNDAQLRSLDATIALRAAATAAGVKRFIALGSQAEGAHSPYGRAKSIARDVLSLARGEGSWVRLFSVYGPGDRRGDSVLVRMIRHGIAWEKARTERAPSPGPFVLKSTGEHKWHYLHEDDAAKAILDLAATSDAPSRVDLYGSTYGRLRHVLLLAASTLFPGMSIKCGSRIDSDLPPGDSMPISGIPFHRGLRQILGAMKTDERGGAKKENH